MRFPGATRLVVLARYQGQRLQQFLETKLEGWMGLEINRDKTRVVDLMDEGASLDFLGYTFRFDRDLFGRKRKYLNLFPAEKSLKRERQKIKDMTGPQKCCEPIPQLIQELNRHLRGWRNYFSIGHPGKAYGKINWYVRFRLVRHLRRRSQRPFRKPKGLSYFAFLEQLGLILLEPSAVGQLPANASGESS